MKNTYIVLILLIILGLGIWFVSSGRLQKNPDNVQIANPASVFCVDNGGRLEMRTDANGGQVGFCIFEDNTECEEWAYFRNECGVKE